MRLGIFEQKLAVFILLGILLSPLSSKADIFHDLFHRDIDPVLYESGQRNKDSMLKYLIPTLLKYGKSARIYFASQCPEDEDYPYFPYPFPAVKLQKPSKNASGLNAIKEMFRDDADVVVAENPKGIITIKIGKISHELLRTHISKIIFSRPEQYNDFEAIGAIISAQEVRDKSKQLGIRYDSRPISHLSGRPVSGQAHLPDSLINVTVDEALDKIAETFGSIVMYGTCAKQPYVTIEGTGGPNTIYSKDSPW